MLFHNWTACHLGQMMSSRIYSFLVIPSTSLPHFFYKWFYGNSPFEGGVTALASSLVFCLLPSFCWLPLTSWICFCLDVIFFRFVKIIFLRFSSLDEILCVCICCSSMLFCFFLFALEVVQIIGHIKVHKLNTLVWDVKCVFCSGGAFETGKSNVLKIYFSLHTVWNRIRE